MYSTLKAELSFCIILRFICDWSVSRYYIGQRPDILLADPEIIKHVTVKEFSYFTDREVSSSKS